MIELQGKYNSAKVFTDSIEQEAIAQIINLLNQEFVSGSTIRIMPDAHAGAGCTIGTTMTINDRVVPNLVGVDIGCGMETVILKNTNVELSQLDKVIHELIPVGFAIRAKAHPFNDEIDLNELRCAKRVNLDRAIMSMGTLGGGNHFIELDKDEEGRLYLVIHSGSRNLGKQVADHYQKAAVRELERNRSERSMLVSKLTQEGRKAEIEVELKKLNYQKIDRSLAFTEGQLFEDYIFDMTITQRYALLNRQAIVKDIVKAMKFKVEDQFTTVHNYIDMSTMILRKGAISAKKDERVIIPINMRDGSLICSGKGNPDWNYSAPHGAGRLMSRKAANQRIPLTQFKEAMKGIYSSTVTKATIGESPFAYKPLEDIVNNIGATAEIIKTIKPLYNFKAAD